MSAKIIDGKALAKKVKQDAAKKVEELKKLGVTPRLVVFLVGDDPASAVYVAGKERDCIECGIDGQVVRLPAETSEAELVGLIKAENENGLTHGILVQLPLPGHISEEKINNLISPDKDVDGFTPVNIGRLQIGEDCFVPCTPAGSLMMIEEAGLEISGKEAVVVGRSNIVGKPMAMLLISKNATVTVCHTKTQDMAFHCRRADILVAAAGRRGLISADMVKPGAVVIDVGMNRNEEGKLCGDVDFESVSKVAGAITPVPGGVGPMTRAMLMVNTVKASKMAMNRDK